MEMLRLALLIAGIGLAIFVAGILLSRLLGTIRTITYGLYRPLSLDFIDQVMVYLPHPRYLRHPKRFILYLRRYDISFLLVFAGEVIIFAAAAMVVIAVFQAFLT